MYCPSFLFLFLVSKLQKCVFCWCIQALFLSVQCSVHITNSWNIFCLLAMKSKGKVEKVSASVRQCYLGLSASPLERRSEISVKFSGWVRQDFKRPWKSAGRTLPHHDNIICWWKLNQAVSLFFNTKVASETQIYVVWMRREKRKTARLSWASLRPSPSAGGRKLGLGGASHVWLQCDLTLLHQSTYSPPIFSATYFLLIHICTYFSPIFSATYFLLIRTLFTHF